MIGCIVVVWLPVNGADAGNILLVANAFGQEPVSDLPGEHGGILALVVGDGVDDVGRGHLGFAPANHARLEAASFVVSRKGESQDTQNVKINKKANTAAWQEDTETHESTSRSITKMRIPTNYFDHQQKQPTSLWVY